MKLKGLFTSKLRSRLEKLEREIDFYKLIAENTYDLEIFRKPDGKIIYVNRAFERITGYPCEDVLNGNVTEKELIHADDIRNVNLQINAVLSGNPVEDVNFRIIRKDGKVRYCNLCATPVYKDNVILGIRSSVRDVTSYTNDFEDLHIARNKAVQISERYKETLNELNKAQSLAKTGSWKWHIKENRLEWSDQMYTIFNVDRDTFTGNLREAIDARVHPDDREIVNNSNKLVAETGRLDAIEYRILHPDGTIKILWAEGGEIILDKDSNPAIITGVVKDITDYRNLNSDLIKAKEIAEQKEEKFRMFIDQTSEGIYLLEVIPPAKTDLPIEEMIDYLYEKTVLTECNNSFMSMYGVSDINEVLGKSLLDFHGGLNNAENRDEIRQFVNQGFKTVNAETHEKNSNGELRYFSNNTIGIVQDGYVTRMWGTQTDITSLREKEHELFQAKEKAEESDRLKTAFLNNMSHEVRTPLNGIVGFSRLLSNPELTDEKRAEFSIFVTKSSEKLIEIMSDLTEISKIHISEVNVYPEKFDLHSIVSDIVRSYSETVSRKNLQIMQGSHGGLIIYSDQGKVRKILLHLIDNAVKFTRKGSIWISYEIKNDYISIIVEDTGPGIPGDKTDIIFEPFRQLSTHEGGNGLGLSIVKAYTEALNGSVRIDSIINKGTKFTVTFPANFSKNMNTLSLDEHFTPGAENKSIARKILIAEDEYINFLYLKEILQSDKVEIIHAINGKVAVDICRKDEDIDLVLMDLMMPEMDGSSAAKIIRTFKPGIPIILQTAYSFDTDIT
ncbi:MAG: PAS domain-containing protein, partial [Methanosarcina sp.]